MGRVQDGGERREKQEGHSRPLARHKQNPEWCWAVNEARDHLGAVVSSGLGVLSLLCCPFIM